MEIKLLDCGSYYIDLEVKLTIPPIIVKHLLLKVLKGAEIEQEHTVSDIEERTEKLNIIDLQPQTFYTVKIQLINTSNQTLDEKSLIVYTLSPEADQLSQDPQIDQKIQNQAQKDASKRGLSKSEKLAIDTFPRDHPLYNIIGGKKNIHRAVMASRKTKNLKTFLNSDFKFCRPKKKQRERLQRALIYTNVDQKLRARGVDQGDFGGMGRKMFNGDWGMGPCYVWDNNYGDKIGDGGEEVEVGVGWDEGDDGVPGNGI